MRQPGITQKQWQLTCRSEQEGTSFVITGDGLVITGPGTPLTVPGQPKTHPRIMDGASFWLHTSEFAQLRSEVKQPLNIGVIGTGETAAAIAVALVDTLRDAAFIEVISPYGVNYSRDTRVLRENRLFSDPDGKLANLLGDHQHAANWLQLSERDRREFVRRTDRGVFSLKAMEVLSDAKNVRSVLGTVRHITAHDTRVRIESEYDGEMHEDEYDYVVVARGFDALWFRHLLDADTHTRMAEVTHSFDGHDHRARHCRRPFAERVYAQTPSSHAGSDCPGTRFSQPQLSWLAGRPHPGSLLSVQLLYPTQCATSETQSLLTSLFPLFAFSEKECDHERTHPEGMTPSHLPPYPIGTTRDGFIGNNVFKSNSASSFTRTSGKAKRKSSRLR